jgi:hypothetical protein
MLVRDGGGGGVGQQPLGVDVVAHHAGLGSVSV